MREKINPNSFERHKRLYRVLLYQVNAPENKSVVTMAAVIDRDFELFNRLPYSTDFPAFMHNIFHASKVVSEILCGGSAESFITYIFIFVTELKCVIYYRISENLQRSSVWSEWYIHSHSTYTTQCTTCQSEIRIDFNLNCIYCRLYLLIIVIRNHWTPL